MFTEKISSSEKYFVDFVECRSGGQNCHIITMSCFALYSEFHACNDDNITYNRQPRLSRIQLHEYKNVRKLQCYPKEIAYLTSDQSLVSFWASSYFSVCRHFATISDLLFSISFPSCSAMASFSVRQRAHRLA